MINISPFTKDQESIAAALNGKWERNTTREGETTWVILGQIVFLDGDKSRFPYEVLTWHTSDGKGYWAILK